MMIRVERIKDEDEDCYEIYEVYGEKLKPIREKDVSIIFNNSWGLELFRWNQWLGYLTNEDDLKELTEEDYVACCLWEMTFLGFSEKEIEEISDELNRMVEEIKFKK